MLVQITSSAILEWQVAYIRKLIMTFLAPPSGMTLLRFPKQLTSLPCGCHGSRVGLGSFLSISCLAYYLYDTMFGTRLNVFVRVVVSGVFSSMLRCYFFLCVWCYCSYALVYFHVVLLFLLYFFTLFYWCCKISCFVSAFVFCFVFLSCVMFFFVFLFLMWCCYFWRAIYMLSYVLCCCCVIFHTVFCFCLFFCIILFTTLFFLYCVTVYYVILSMHFSKLVFVLLKLSYARVSWVTIS